MEGNKKYGHMKMVAWQSIDQLDIIVQEVLKCISKYEYKTKSQIDNASDSMGSNFVEGYYSGAIGEYIRFLKYARRSCAEVHERVRRLLRKQVISQDLFNKFEERQIKTMYLLDRLIASLEEKRNNEQKEKSKRK